MLRWMRSCTLRVKGGAVRRLVAIALCVAAMLAVGVGGLFVATGARSSPASAGPYSWPLRPFETPHAVRAYFDDPRILRNSKTFHFGIDISAREGTLVYSVEGGTAHVTQDSLAVVMDGEPRTFSYWHVVPVVGDHSAVRKYQVIAVVPQHMRHLHFAELSGSAYRNPLRPGALTPWTDTRAPVIRSVGFVNQRRHISRHALSGDVDVVVDAYDLPSITVPAPWTNMPVSPALVRWRVLQGNHVVQRWRTPIDFRLSLLARSQFRNVYAPGTRQNRVDRPGRYLYFLAHGWSTRSLSNGDYRVEVEVTDTRRNVAKASLRVRIANATGAHLASQIGAGSGPRPSA
jgi:hypothetical protein